MKITGITEFRNKLDKLTRNLKKLDGNHQVPLSELLTPTFVSRHTSFASADDMLKQSGFKVESTEDLAAIDSEKWDAYIQSISSFNNWNSMVSKAAGEWVKKRMGI